MGVLQTSIYYFVELIQLLILVRIVLSFIIRDPRNDIFRLVHQITEPILAPFRNLINKLGVDTGMIDFSPILCLITLRLVARILISVL